MFIRGIGVAVGVLMSGAAALGQFNFTPLPSSVAVGSLPETAPFLLAPELGQTRITHRFQNGAGSPVGGLWDMIAVNETGPQAGQFLFIAYETSTRAGIGRVDLATNQISTIALNTAFRRFDGCLWSPWQTIITGEETTAGLVYEVLNPLAAPGSVNIVARPAVGRAAHEGFKIDAAGNLYFVDEFNGGSLYKFVPTNPLTSAALASGQIFALSDVNVADGANVGSAVWTPLNNPDGTPIPGVTDPTIDARTAADNVGASNYGRPEDLELGTLASGNEVIYMATTTTDQVFSVELTGSTAAMVRQFVWNGTIDAATGVSVDVPGDVFANPDNLAVDANGTLYVLEDNSPGDVWAVLDSDNDGVAEQIARWASLSTSGAEPTGLFFDPLDPTSAYINAQHPFSGDDSLFRIALPPPPPCPGDANRDGTVDFTDITSVVANWLNDYTADPTGTGPGDADGSGVVDFADITSVVANWFGVCP